MVRSDRTRRLNPGFGLTTSIQTAAREYERLVTVMKQRLEGTFSEQDEPPVLVQHDPCPEFPAFAIQRLLQPLNIRA